MYYMYMYVHVHVHVVWFCPSTGNLKQMCCNMCCNITVPPAATRAAAAAALLLQTSFFCAVLVPTCSSYSYVVGIFLRRGTMN